MPFLNKKRLAPHKSTFEGFKNGLRFWLVSLNMCGWISHLKVRLFFIRAVISLGVNHHINYGTLLAPHRLPRLQGSREVTTTPFANSTTVHKKNNLSFPFNMQMRFRWQEGEKSYFGAPSLWHIWQLSWRCFMNKKKGRGRKFPGACPVCLHVFEIVKDRCDGSGLNTSDSSKGSHPKDS